MVRDAVEQGSSEAFIAKHLNPIGELEVGGQDQSQALVDFGAKGEQGMGAAGRKGDEAELVDHDQIELESSSDEAVQTMLILSLEQLIHQSGGGPEADFAPLATGG